MYVSQVGRRSAAAQPGNRFISFVRARGDCQVEMSLKRRPRRFPSSLLAWEAFPFPWGSSPPPKLLSSFSWLYRYTVYKD